LAVALAESELGPQIVSRETIARLQKWRELVLKWDKVHNLTGPAEHGRLWRRHILDGMQVLHTALASRDCEQSTLWADIGTGAGVPGLICALGAAEWPTWRFVLIEPLQKRAAFLREVIRATGALADVLVGRAEEAVSGQIQADIASARAVASLPKLMEWAVPLLKKTERGEIAGRCLFLKGETLSDELTAAREYWRFSERLHPSLSVQPLSQATKRGVCEPLAQSVTASGVIELSEIRRATRL
jgi:16S rRNA (guanine527-N7)-methyltransferase